MRPPRSAGRCPRWGGSGASPSPAWRRGARGSGRRPRRGQRRRARPRPPGGLERRATAAHAAHGDAPPRPQARDRRTVRRRWAGRGLRAGARLMPTFRVERPEPRIVHLVMDDPARKVNVLDEAALADLEVALAPIEADRGPA